MMSVSDLNDSDDDKGQTFFTGGEKRYRNTPTFSLSLACVLIQANYCSGIQVVDPRKGNDYVSGVFEGARRFVANRIESNHTMLMIRGMALGVELTLSMSRHHEQQHRSTLLALVRSSLDDDDAIARTDCNLADCITRSQT
jgi:hypothetical protein